jgi:hypothetical protein
MCSLSEPPLRKSFGAAPDPPPPSRPPPRLRARGLFMALELGAHLGTLKREGELDPMFSVKHRIQLKHIFQAYGSVRRNPKLAKKHPRPGIQPYWAPTLLNRVFGPTA